ncbi:MAG: hypothetical protein EU540_03100 [Promethearchaeota archaeon]|nr:MAG: hypothetical protein EU540_03100 [Candidatus Lokiarchaeota archaeon]
MVKLGYPFRDGNKVFGRDIDNPYVQFIDDEIYLIFEDEGTYKLYTSKDEAHSWTYLNEITNPIEPSHLHYDLDFLNLYEVALIFEEIKDGKAHCRFTKSENRGESWSDDIEIMESSIITPVICYINYSHIFLGFNSKHTDFVELFLSKNSGYNWENIASLNTSIIDLPMDVIYHKEILYMYGWNEFDDVVFLQSQNFGINWTIQSSDLSGKRSADFGPITIDSDDNFFYCYLYGGIIKVFKSKNFGIDWKEIKHSKLEKEINTSGDISMGISKEDDIFIAYQVLYDNINPTDSDEGIDYFWLNQEFTEDYLFWNVWYLIIRSLTCIGIMTVSLMIYNSKKAKKKLKRS